MNKEYIKLVEKYILNAAILVFLVIATATCTVFILLLDEEGVNALSLTAACLAACTTYLVVRQGVLLSRIEKMGKQIIKKP
jgi:uncharacterized membrane protein